MLQVLEPWAQTTGLAPSLMIRWASWWGHSDTTGARASWWGHSDTTGAQASWWGHSDTTGAWVGRDTVGGDTVTHCWGSTRLYDHETTYLSSESPGPRLGWVLLRTSWCSVVKWNPFKTEWYLLVWNSSTLIHGSCTPLHVLTLSSNYSIHCCLHCFQFPESSFTDIWGKPHILQNKPKYCVILYNHNTV